MSLSMYIPTGFEYEFEERSCTKLLSFIRDELDDLDKIDVHLLRLEFRSADDEERRAKLADYKAAYSSDLSDLTKKLVHDVRLGMSCTTTEISLGVDEIMTQWENGRYGTKN